MATIHEQIAKDVGGRWWWLTCPTCSDKYTITKAQFAAFLARGWPKCCGYTMRLEQNRSAK